MKCFLDKFKFLLRRREERRPLDLKHADKKMRSVILREEADAFAKRYGKVMEALSKE